MNNNTGEIDNLSELRREQSYRVCVQVRVSCAADTYLSSLESGDGFSPFVGRPQVEGVIRYNSEFSLSKDTKVCLQ